MHLTSWAACAPAAVAWLLVLRLVWALLRTDLTFAYVAEHTSVGEAWWYRVAATWGGMEGSLLLFAAMLATAAAVAVCKEAPAARRWLLHGWTVLLAVAVVALALLFASPFDRLDVPAVQGFGLTPILRHWAMVVHPPLLYAGVVCTVPPYASRRRAHRWLLASMALLTVAMALGGFWSYAEQGWGGYWAWDPVENTSLAVWMAALVAIHAGRGSSRRAAAVRRLPFVVALAGAAVARSGVTASVHSFAESVTIGVALGAVAGAALVGAGGVAAVEAAEQRSVAAGAPAARLDGWRTTAALLIGGALAIVVLFTAAPLLATDGEGARVNGRWFARPLGAFAAVVVFALIALLVRARGRVGRGGWIAHSGMVVLLLGAVGSSFDRWEDRWIATDETLIVAGVEVTNHGVALADGPTPGSTEVSVRLVVAGHERQPALVTFPERGGVLAETSLVSRPWRDVQVTLLTARDDGRALLEVRSKPLVSLVWMGALTVLLGAGVAFADHRRGRAGQGQFRRRRPAARPGVAASAAGAR